MNLEFRLTPMATQPSSDWVYLLHMYVRVLFMSEFPDLRHFVKIRDFDPYLRDQSDLSTNMNEAKPQGPVTLQIQFFQVGYSSHSQSSHSSDPLGNSQSCENFTGIKGPEAITHSSGLFYHHCNTEALFSSSLKATLQIHFCELWRYSSVYQGRHLGPYPSGVETDGM